MFQWAQSTFDKLSQTVAPPPEDGPGRFAYCVQRGEEDAAMGCIAGMDPVHSVVNQAKGQYPIHLACQYSCMRLIQLLLSQPGMNIGQTDLAGNTPLHYASMSMAPHGLDAVKMLVATYGASVLAKNMQGQTPYDVATKNAIRQHLLPIQLQAETQIALDNGGQGLPPGIDMGGLRINNPSIAPPPTFGGGPPGTPGQPAGGEYPAPQHGMGAPGSPAPPHVPSAHMFGTPSPSHPGRGVSAPAAASPAIPAPDSQGYSRVGSSSAAMTGVGKYRADGFHSSSSDVSLQRKYGHASTSYGRTIAPPPSSGNSSVGMAVAAAGAMGNNNNNGMTSPNPINAGGPNPFSAGGAGSSARGRYGALNGRSRYVTYGQVAPPAAAAASVAPPAAYAAYPAAAAAAAAPVAAANFSMFTPSGGPAVATQSAPTSAGAAPSSYSGGVAPAPSSSNTGTSTSTLTTPYMPPPPYQSHNYAADVNQNSANMADANANDIFAAPSPQKGSNGGPGSELAPQQASEPAGAAVEASATTAADTTTTEATTTGQGAITEDWVETVDPSSGQIYYYNTVTNETSWDKPTATAGPTTTGSTLAADWVETVDPTSGQVYYYNSVTHETSWEKPVAPAVAAETSSSVPVEQPSQPSASQEAAAVAEAESASTPVSMEAPEAFSAQPAEEATTTTPTAGEATQSSALAFAPAPLSGSDAFSVPPPSETTPATPAAEVAGESSAPALTPAPISASDAFSSAPPAEAVAESSAPAFAPSPISASDAFAAPPPSAADAFGSPSAAMTPTAEPEAESALAPTPAPVCASDAFTAPPPSSADSFSFAPPPSETTLTPTAGTTNTSPFMAPPQRSISADELFAEEPPVYDDAGENVVTPQKAPPSSEDAEGGDEDLMDDVPLSPTEERPTTESSAAANGTLPQLGTPTDNPPAVAADSGAESLFAAIGMPPPPFSARKR